MLNKRADKLELLRIAEAVALEKSIDKELNYRVLWRLELQKLLNQNLVKKMRSRYLINRDNGDIGIFRKLVIS